MRLYETAFLIAPSLPEEEADKLVEKMQETVAKKKGKMIQVNKWGKKKLAYPIQKHGEAFYVFFSYEGDPDIPQELERQFRQTEAIIRYLTLKKEDVKVMRKKKAAVRKARKAPAKPKEKDLDSGEKEQAELNEKEEKEEKEV